MSNKLSAPPPQPTSSSPNDDNIATGTVVSNSSSSSSSSSPHAVDALPGTANTNSFDNVNEVINWSREQDNRLRDLKAQHDRDGKLPSDLHQEYEALSKQYLIFEEEGIKRLMLSAGPNPTATATSGAAASSHHHGGGFFGFLGRTADYVSEGASKLKPHVQEAGRAAWFYSSLGVTAAAPGFLGKKLGLTDRYDHWNWIIPYTKSNRQGGLILGGIPVMTKAMGSGCHLKQIHEEAKAQGTEMGMVVSIVLPSEMDGFGVSFIKFAKHQDWKDEFGKDFRCRLLPIEDNTANGFSFDMVMTTLDEMNEVMLTGKTVYVHCAKGVGRSLTMVVCYLMVFLNKNPDEALAHAKACRHQVSPNKVQMDFIRSFYAMWKRMETLENEERHKKYDHLPNVGLDQLLKQQEEKDVAHATENSLKEVIEEKIETVDEKMKEKEDGINTNDDDDDDDDANQPHESTSSKTNALDDIFGDETKEEDVK